VETGRCLGVLEGHTYQVWSVAWGAGERWALSGGLDGSVLLWDLEAGKFQRLGTQGAARQQWVRSVQWSTDGRHVIAGHDSGLVQLWDLSEYRRIPQPPAKADKKLLAPAPDQIQYTNAKVLLVGESGVGKTGLSRVLCGNVWQPSDSTVGAWATQWQLPIPSSSGIERDIWLWDFGGQADQRLIHQLYMEGATLAILVFDGQKEDVFETLGQWDRDLTRASNTAFSKLLVLGRSDAGGLRVSRARIENFCKERGFSMFLETSAKIGTGCEECRMAIIDTICWDNIPWRSSPILFKHLKEEIVRLKDEGIALLRANELREMLQLRLLGKSISFSDDELLSVVKLLVGPGVVWQLNFGSWVLLQPERINAYAQAVIQTIRDDRFERGCIEEDKVLRGELTYHSSIERLKEDENVLCFLAMHQMLVQQGLCIRENTEHGTLLIFPSYY
jgi:small GTP-binding protein